MTRLNTSPCRSTSTQRAPTVCQSRFRPSKLWISKACHPLKYQAVVCGMGKIEILFVFVKNHFCVRIDLHVSRYIYP